MSLKPIKCGGVKLKIETQLVSLSAFLVPALNQSPGSIPIEVRISTKVPGFGRFLRLGSSQITSGHVECIVIVNFRQALIFYVTFLSSINVVQ